MTWNDYYFLFLYSSCVKWPVKVCLSGKFGQKWPKIGQNMQKSSFLTFWPKLSNHSQLILIGNDFKRLIFFFIMSSSNFQSSAISATSTISAILAILYLRVSNIPFGLFFTISSFLYSNALLVNLASLSKSSWKMKLQKTFTKLLLLNHVTNYKLNRVK